LGLEREQILPSLRSKVLDVVRFIENHVYPRHPAKYVLVAENELIGCDADMKSVRCLPSLSSLLALPDIAIVREDLEPWHKFLELHFPVLQNTCGYDDEMWSPAIEA
jgi:hypothetical protein